MHTACVVRHGSLIPRVLRAFTAPLTAVDDRRAIIAAQLAITLDFADDGIKSREISRGVKGVISGDYAFDGPFWRPKSIRRARLFDK